MTNWNYYHLTFKKVAKFRFYFCIFILGENEHTGGTKFGFRQL